MALEACFVNQQAPETSLEKDFPINLLLLAKDETPEFFAHSGKFSLGLIKSSENPSAEERKNVYCLSTQRAPVGDSTWTYSPVVASYLFPQVGKLPLLIEASQVKKGTVTHFPKQNCLEASNLPGFQKFCLGEHIPFSYFRGHLVIIADSQRGGRVRREGEKTCSQF